MPASFTSDPNPVFSESWLKYLTTELGKISDATRVMTQAITRAETNPKVATKSGFVTAGDIPVGTWQIVNDTVNNTTGLYANIGGTLKSVMLT